VAARQLNQLGQRMRQLDRHGSGGRRRGRRRGTLATVGGWRRRSGSGSGGCGSCGHLVGLLRLHLQLMCLCSLLLRLCKLLCARRS
jgi:hypothetical protein